MRGRANPRFEFQRPALQENVSGIAHKDGLFNEGLKSVRTIWLGQREHKLLRAAKHIDLVAYAKPALCTIKFQFAAQAHARRCIRIRDYNAWQHVSCANKACRK